MEPSWYAVLTRAFERWSVEAIGRDFVVNLVGSVLASLVVFLIASRWPLIRSYLVRDAAAFRRFFGPGAIQDGRMFITLDVYQNINLLSPELRERLRGVPPPATTAANPAGFSHALRLALSTLRVRRRGSDAQRTTRASSVPGAGATGNSYFKRYPDGHFTAFSGGTEGLLGYRTARAAFYLIEALSRIPSIAVGIRTVSDSDVAGRWDATFINLGGSYSNIRTDDIKHMYDGTLFHDDNGVFTLEGHPVQQEKDRSKKGIVVRRGNPYSPEHALVVCAGLGEWGTSGAAWFLAQNWKRLSRRFGRRPFGIVVSVVPPADQSAREILFVGRELVTYRVGTWVKAVVGRLAARLRHKRARQDG